MAETGHDEVLQSQLPRMFYNLQHELIELVWDLVRTKVLTVPLVERGAVG